MGSLDHDGLLTLARKAYAAAGDADTARLTESLCAFVHTLAHHLDHEIPSFTRLPPAEARLALLSIQARDERLVFHRAASGASNRRWPR